MKYTGVKKIAGMSKSLKGRCGNRKIQVNVNKETGEMKGIEIFSMNSWVDLKDENLVKFDICDPVTMKQLSDLADRAIEEDRQTDAWIAYMDKKEQ